MIIKAKYEFEPIEFDFDIDLEEWNDWSEDEQVFHIEEYVRHELIYEILENASLSYKESKESEE